MLLLFCVTTVRGRVVSIFSKNQHLKHTRDIHLLSIKIFYRSVNDLNYFTIEIKNYNFSAELFSKNIK